MWCGIHPCVSSLSISKESSHYLRFCFMLNLSSGVGTWNENLFPQSCRTYWHIFLRYRTYWYFLHKMSTWHLNSYIVLNRTPQWIILSWNLYCGTKKTSAGIFVLNYWIKNIIIYSQNFQSNGQKIAVTESMTGSLFEGPS